MTNEQKKHKIERFKKINSQLESKINEQCRAIRDLRKRIEDNKAEMERLENEILFDVN